MSTRPAFQLHRFTPRPSASVPLEWVQDLRAEDFRVAQMFHHGGAALKVAVLSLLRMTPDAGVIRGRVPCEFVPVDTWWTHGQPFVGTSIATADAIPMIDGCTRRGTVNEGGRLQRFSGQ